MSRRSVKRKPYVVDGQPYEVSVTAIYEEVVKLRVTIRACFGCRSFCVINGLRNFDYYYNYGYWNDSDINESESTIMITPRMIAALIRYARQADWLPEASRSTCRINIANVDAKKILATQSGEPELTFTRDVES